MIRSFAASLIAASLLLGCSTRPITERLQFGMTKRQVSLLMGDTLVPRGVTFNKSDQIVEVFQYSEYEKKEGAKVTSDVLVGQPSSFYLFFYQDQLVQWGAADDWREAAKLLYETNFK